MKKRSKKDEVTPDEIAALWTDHETPSFVPGGSKIVNGRAVEVKPATPAPPAGFPSPSGAVRFTPRSGGGSPQPTKVATVKVAKRRRDEPREIDLVLNSMKRTQQAKEEGKTEVVTKKGGTTLHVSGLSPEIKEEELLDHCIPHGPIAVLRIMETKLRLGGKGRVALVSFMEYEAAVAAHTALQRKGFNVQWGAGGRLPKTPLFEAREGSSEDAEGVPCGKRWRVNPEEKRVAVSTDFDPWQRRLIDLLSQHVMAQGIHLEDAVRHREQGNPHFAFLSAPPDDPQHVYYRWRVYSLLQGDSLKHWRTLPFRMFTDSPVWVPPPCTGGELYPTKRRRMLTTLPSQPSAPSDGKTLAPKSRNKLIQMLRELTTEDESVKEAMLWVVERSYAADEIVGILVESLSLLETPPKAKLARLYLVSDILYNTNNRRIKGVTRFRTLLLDLLGKVFNSLGETSRSLHGAGRTTELAAFEAAVSKVLLVWNKWGVFPSTSIQQWQLMSEKRAV